MFPSDGFGGLPKEAKDLDINKIVLFMLAVKYFWLAGGGLLLFSDKYPYNYETNLLLEKYLSFMHGGRIGLS